MQNVSPSSVALLNNFKNVYKVEHKISINRETQNVFNKDWGPWCTLYLVFSIYLTKHALQSKALKCIFKYMKCSYSLHP